MLAGLLLFGKIGFRSFALPIFSNVSMVRTYIRTVTARSNPLFDLGWLLVPPLTLPQVSEALFKIDSVCMHVCGF